jgi:hypothetical protein
MFGWIGAPSDLVGNHSDNRPTKRNTISERQGRRRIESGPTAFPTAPAVAVASPHRPQCPIPLPGRGEGRGEGRVVVVGCLRRR